MDAYGDLSDEEKQKLHDETLEELTASIEDVKTKLETAYVDYKRKKETFKNFQKNPPKTKAPKTREAELDAIIYPLELEREVERAAAIVDRLRRLKTSIARDLKNEKMFTLEF